MRQDSVEVGNWEHRNQWGKAARQSENPCTKCSCFSAIGKGHMVARRGWCRLLWTSLR